MDVKLVVKQLGGPTAVAARLRSKHRDGSISPAAVSKWRKVPADRVMDLVEMSGGKLTPNDLRPDVFGPAMEASNTESRPQQEAA